MKPKLYLKENGQFKVDYVDKISYLYFPLTNYYSLKSSISPNLSGDAKINQNSFALVPTSSEDIQNSFYNRNIYFRINDEYTWSITGNTPYQMLNKDEVSLEADFLVHKIIRSNNHFSCEIESFVPFNDSYQELHKIVFKNKTDKTLIIKPVISFPLYSRSADNLRDHRHVTSLLNRARIYKNGILNSPTFSFDERGHNLNKNNYGVFISEDYQIKNYWPILEEFIGEGNNILDPIVVKEDLTNDYKINESIEGYEITSGMELEKTELNKNQEFSIVLSMIIDEDINKIKNQTNSLNIKTFDILKQDTLIAWKKELESLDFKFKDPTFNGWLKWVTLQPILRRIYGCSFMPHHDYGRGGRGWRDLWQDLLALILMNPKNVRNQLLNNYKGVRIDGSNATIIGENPGEFLADRNNIARVWMDHGSWPLLTTMLYIDKSGDYKILLEEQNYFYDKFTHYTKKINNEHVNKDNLLQDANNQIYKGTILEHILVQNLLPIYNLGKHSNIRIEDADWNDAYDMAHQNGESVAFTSLYASNLFEIAKILRKLNEKGIENISILREIYDILIDNDYKTISNKHINRDLFLDSVETGCSGVKVLKNVKEIASSLEDKGKTLLMHIRHNEWLEGKEYSWFNGYYDNDSQPLDDVAKENMTLTGQVFAIFSGAATDDQIKEIIRSADKHLYNKDVGGYLLNTDFKELKLNMGRAFGFAYGHKENGAMFSHMAVMYANALYKRGFAHAGYKVLNTIYEHCINIDKSKIYPGIPEYINPKGRGMYHYLTGSASWYILTEVTEVFGIKGDFGSLVIEPKLLKEQFDDSGLAKISTLINGKRTNISFINKNNLDFGEYKIDKVFSDEVEVDFIETKYGVKIHSDIKSLNLNIILGKK